MDRGSILVQWIPPIVSDLHALVQHELPESPLLVDGNGTVVERIRLNGKVGDPLLPEPVEGFLLQESARSQSAIPLGDEEVVHITEAIHREDRDRLLDDNEGISDDRLFVFGYEDGRILRMDALSMIFRDLVECILTFLNELHIRTMLLGHQILSVGDEFYDEFPKSRYVLQSSLPYSDHEEWIWDWIDKVPGEEER